MSIKISTLPIDKRATCPKELSFGNIFSDHMFVQKYNHAQGWHDAEIKPFENISLSPAAAVLHYGQEVFEGLKAYRNVDGGINLFRPLENIRRMNRSATRMVMPVVDERLHMEALKQLLALDEAWVPNTSGASLYIRPTLIATSPHLGLAASQEYMHFIITGPVGPYFPEGFKPVSVYVSDKYRRAVVGGVGAAKTGGNYAASLMMCEDAQKKGYSQVLWLDAVDGRYVEEVGAMNICFVYEGKHIVTPALTGSILPGITRDSVLKIARHVGYEVAEERLDIHTILKDIQAGAITEAFGCGTAAVISPVNRFHFLGEDYAVAASEAGPVSRALFDELTNIQYGRSKDPFGWVEAVT